MKMLFKSNLFGLGILFGLSFLLIAVTNKYILSAAFYNNSSAILSGIPGQDTTVYEMLQKWIYLTDFIYTLFKITLVALILYTALYLNDHTVKFGQILNVVIYCEFVFLIPAAIKIPWFIYKYPHGNLTDWHHTYILSALSLFDAISPDWSYPLQTLNVFEVVYWFLLAYGISRAACLDFDRSLLMVVVSYLPGLVIWVSVIAFCTIIMFPNYG